MGNPEKFGEQQINFDVCPKFQDAAEKSGKCCVEDIRHCRKILTVATMLRLA
jgi:hypothetical protein